MPPPYPKATHNPYHFLLTSLLPILSSTLQQGIPLSSRKVMLQGAHHSSSLWLIKNSFSCCLLNSSLQSEYFLSASSSEMESSHCSIKALKVIIGGCVGPSSSNLKHEGRENGNIQHFIVTNTYFTHTQKNKDKNYLKHYWVTWSNKS